MMLLAARRYTASAPITVPSNDYTIEGLDIVSTAGHAIAADSRTGLVIRKNRIHHKGGRGITLIDCPGAVIEDNDIIFDKPTWFPVPGPAPGESDNAIRLLNCDGAQVLRNRFARGNGLYVEASDAVLIQYLEMRDLKGLGSFGFGGGVQIKDSVGVSLLDFYNKNVLGVAWPGDNINVSGGSGHTISRGLIDGGDGFNTACVQIQEAEDCTVSDVDAINWCNQAFSTYLGTDITFTTCRARDSFTPCTQSRGLPSSGGNAFSSFGPATRTKINGGSKYFNLAGGAGHILYDEGGGSVIENDLASEDFTPRTPYTWVPAYA